ncbi:MAG: phage holin family protein [Sulfuricella denitrificans]|nr:phage holin family protein [Sulfuricella denitrificans]
MSVGPSPDHGGRPGLFDSVKGLAASGVAVVRTRLELLSTEVAEEKERFLSLLWLGLAALFFIGLGIVFAAVLLTVAFWDSHRLLVLAMLTLLFLGVGIAALSMALRQGREGPKLFSASLAELSKDQEQLRQ